MERHDRNREMMGKALKEFGERAEGAEWAMVFFAGHGMELDDETHIIPTDAELSRDTHVVDACARRKQRGENGHAPLRLPTV